MVLQLSTRGTADSDAARRGRAAPLGLARPLLNERLHSIKIKLGLFASAAVFDQVAAEDGLAEGRPLLRLPRPPIQHLPSTIALLPVQRIRVGKGYQIKEGLRASSYQRLVTYDKLIQGFVQSLFPLMRKHGVKRILAMSTVSAPDEHDGFALVRRLLVSLVSLLLPAPYRTMLGFARVFREQATGIPLEFAPRHVGNQPTVSSSVSDTLGPPPGTLHNNSHLYLVSSHPDHPQDTR
ncbi:hypothetical protein CONLIGDRAFT_699783 [Coniochaeta ligniaria NRRL 30616]|uniref:Uncharacterized protein n=1 Tax=Coniochaeta ligniaria NRRL 30616 TaxID=1408157 RepID=A0A1J7IZG0_9PEZI|nr:hypothetical protein CONLIGDRAFT_699783 [Coniochaeta ligniaria NRRL 30616]